ncbi:MAG: TrpB-like pyridoxal phosphate-dependent enzyme [bacterium]|nr:TrpB-like pyridoxal phosphate-dependent enzyme [bacterium]
MTDKKILLQEKDIPTQWYNLMADLPTPLRPPLHPGTHQPLTPQELAPLFPEALIKQEMSADRWIDIPDEVREVYRLWRPSPLIRASRLEKALDTPAEIWFKWEGVSPAGSHKPNSAVPQAYYNAKEGVRRLTTETGAGQWGSSLAFACAQFGLKCTIYMVRVSFNQKPYRASMMRTWGAEVFASPSDKTDSGRAVLAEDPETNGSLGIAISEAVEDAVKHADAHYALGSVLNHVLIHQSVVGLEARKQLELADRRPDVLVGCVGGGSNFAGFAFPFLPEKIRGQSKVRLVAVEPSACPTLTRGRLAYDFGDTAGLTPLIRMHTLGSHFIPPGFHAGGLRYHGMAPMVSAAVEQGLCETIAVEQLETFKAGMLFTRTEGIMPAPEANHAIRGAIIEAERCKREGHREVIVMNLSGHGHMDMSAYDAYLGGKLVDVHYDEQALALSLSHLPEVK